MKRLSVLILAFALFIAAAGCSAAQTTRGNKDLGQATYATTTAAMKPGAAADSELAGEATAERKIVRNATLDMQVKDVVAAYEELLAYAIQRGGYEVNRNQVKSGDAVTINAQIKIKPEELDGFLAFADGKGEVISSQTSTTDITEAYYDAQIRLETMEKSLETYYGFLNKAKDINESLNVQSQINQLTREIESLKGKITLWESLLAESTVTLRLSQLADPVKIKKEINWSTLTFADMAYLMQSGLTGLLNFIVNVLQWLAISLVVTLPIWVPALVIILVVRRNRKKRRQAWQKALQDGQASQANSASAESSAAPADQTPPPSVTNNP
jgi:hypothetical protein